MVRRDEYHSDWCERWKLCEYPPCGRIFFANHPSRMGRFCSNTHRNNNYNRVNNLMAKNAKRLYEKRKESGACVKCGKPLEGFGGGTGRRNKKGVVCGACVQNDEYIRLFGTSHIRKEPVYSKERKLNARATKAQRPTY